MSSRTSKKRRLWQDGLRFDLLFGCVLEILILLVSILFWHLRFPKIMVAKISVQNVLYLLLLLPLLIGGLGLTARATENRLGSRLCTQLSWPVLFLGLLAALVLLVLPPYCSSTKNPEKYLVLDTDVEPDAESSIRSLFPETLNAIAGDTDYQYYKYSSLFEDMLYITLGETLNVDDFEKESTRLQALPLWTSPNASIHTEGNLTRLDALTPEGLRLHVTLDASCHRILYSASDREASA